MDGMQSARCSSWAMKRSGWLALVCVLAWPLAFRRSEACLRTTQAGITSAPLTALVASYFGKGEGAERHHPVGCLSRCRTGRLLSAIRLWMGSDYPAGLPIRPGFTAVWH